MGIVKCSLSIIVLLSVALPSMSFAAAVRFGDATYDGSKLALLDATSDGGGDYWMAIGPYYVDKPSIGALAYYDYEMQYLISAVEADLGDLAGKEYFDSQTSFFSYNSVEDVGENPRRINTPGGGIIIDASESTFLAYHIEDKSLGDIYGWVEFGIRNDKVTLLNSAIDLSGSPIVVGVIPEPSSGLLLLLGVAGLALRRKRMAGILQGTCRRSGSCGRVGRVRADSGNAIISP